MRIVKLLVLAIAVALVGTLFQSGPTQADHIQPDGPEDFAQLSKNGFALVVDGNFPTLVPDLAGSDLNSYSWSMAEFDPDGPGGEPPKVYVGTVRDLFNSLGLDLPGLDRLGEIWQWTPGPGGPGSPTALDGTWLRVHVSPTVEEWDTSIGGLISSQLPDTALDVGYRNLVVCDADDVTLTDRLYTVALGLGGPPRYTEDGETWLETSSDGLNILSIANLLPALLDPPGLPTMDLGYRALVCFQERLWTSPNGTLFDPDISDNPVVLVNADPSGSGAWEEITDITTEPGVGDPNNLAIFTMATTGDGYLWLGIMNRTGGAEIWRTAGCTTPAPAPCEGGGLVEWQKVIDDGAGRAHEGGPSGPPYNAGPAQMIEYGDYLYAGISESAVFRETTAELIRIELGTDWGVPPPFDLVMGEPRIDCATSGILNFNVGAHTLVDYDGDTVFDDCAPLSDMGPGWGGLGPDYSEGGANYPWRFAVHTDPETADGAPCLYSTTLDLAGFGGPSGVGAGGFDLLRSCDTTESGWEWVFDNGFNNEFNYGGRTMISTDYGLFIGTANPFGSFGFPGDVGTEVWVFPASCAAPAEAQLPVADAGGDQFHFDDENYPDPGDFEVLVDLDGSGSADPFCGDLTYQWYLGPLTGTCDSPTNVVVPGGASDAATVAGVVVLTTDGILDPGGVDDVGVHTFTLRVEDSVGNTDCDEVVITASANLPPSASITAYPDGPLWDDPIIAVYDVDGDGFGMIALTGTCTDPESAIVACDWDPENQIVFVGGDADPGTANSATAALGGGGGDAHDIELDATDDHGYSSAREQLRFRVLAPPENTDGNDAPVCEGRFVTVLMGFPAPVDLCMDPDGDPLFYNWLVPLDPLAHGTLSGGSVVYTPTDIGTDFFVYRACDGSGACSDYVPVFVTVVVGFLGDCNGSGGATQAEAVNIIDALAVALFDARLGDPCVIPSDVNLDGFTNIIDALIIAQYDALIVPELPWPPP